MISQRELQFSSSGSKETKFIYIISHFKIFSIGICFKDRTLCFLIELYLWTQQEEFFLWLYWNLNKKVNWNENHVHDLVIMKWINTLGLAWKTRTTLEEIWNTDIQRRKRETNVSPWIRWQNSLTKSQNIKIAIIEVLFQC